MGVKVKDGDSWVLKDLEDLFEEKSGRVVKNLLGFLSWPNSCEMTIFDLGHSSYELRLNLCQGVLKWKKEGQFNFRLGINRAIDRYVLNFHEDITYTQDFPQISAFLEAEGYKVQKVS